MLKLNNIQELRNLDMEIAQVAQLAFSSGSREKSLFVPTPQALKGVRATLHELFGNVEELDVSHPIVDVLANHFKDYLSSVQLGLDSLVDDPGKVYHMLGAKINGLCFGDHRPEQVRFDVVMENAKNMHLIWKEAIRPQLKKFDDMKLARLQNGFSEAHRAIYFIIPRLRTAFRGISNQRLREIRNALRGVLGNIENSVAVMSGCYKNHPDLPNKSAANGEKAVGANAEEYRRNLKNSVGVDLDEVLSWYEKEYGRTRDEVLSIASKLDNSVKTIEGAGKLLLKHAGPYDSPEEMFLVANGYLLRARAAARKHIWLPEDEICEIAPVPEHLKDFYPWGSYMGDYPSRYPLYNKMFLNGHNYATITDGWLKIIALHEAYPGHHAMFIRSAIDPIPETMKRGASAVAFSEGACIRSESVFEHVYEEDLYFPLMVALRRHHAMIRIKIDLMLFYFGKAVTEVQEFCKKEMGFDSMSAHAQLQIHERMQGYFTGYYYGLKKISSIEKELDWGTKAFTGLLFSVGRVNITTFEKIAKLSPQDRHSLLHDFASKLQFS